MHLLLFFLLFLLFFFLHTHAQFDQSTILDGIEIPEINSVDSILKKAKRAPFLLLLVGGTQHPLEQKTYQELKVVSYLFQAQGGIDLPIFFLDAQSDLMGISRLGISLYQIPSIILFRDGYPRVYQGQRMGSIIYGYIHNLMTSPPVASINSKATKKAFLASSGVKVVGYFEAENGEGWAAFEACAKHYQGELSFGVTTDEKIARSLKLRVPGSVAIMRPNEKALVMGDEVEDMKELIAWIEEHKKPLWQELTVHNLYSAWAVDAKTIVLIMDGTMNEVGVKKVKSDFTNLAKKFARGEPHFEFIFIDASVYPELVRNLGLEDSDLPTMVLTGSSGRPEFYFPKDKDAFNLKNTKRWLKAYVDGRLENKPIYSDESLLLTEAELEEMEEIDKDIFVQFVSSAWCPACDDEKEDFLKLKKRYDEEELSFKVVDTVIVEVSPVVQQKYHLNLTNPFPLYYVFLAEEEIAYQYKDDLTVSALKKWIEDVKNGAGEYETVNLEKDEL